MRYVKSFSIHPATAIRVLLEPYRFSIRGVDVDIHISNEGECRATYEVSIPVDPSGLYLRTGEKPLDGSSPQEGIAVPESSLAGPVVQSLTRVLSFVFDGPLRSASLPGGKLIPECAEDDAILASLKNRPVFVDLRAKLSITAPHFETISQHAMDQLLAREVGLALYQDALHITTEIGKYREFWKVLESAFGQKGAELLKLLEKFTPIVELGFDAPELKDLYLLRGRASHAESSSGLVEYDVITEKVRERLPRLKCLAEQILLTKQTWGTKGQGVDRLADLNTYVRKDGTPVLIRPGISEDYKM